MTDQIRPIGRPDRAAPPVPAVRRLTPREREEAARERARKRRERQGLAPQRDDEQPPAGGGSLDVRA
ncbi:MAG TPA: hypothetical protein VHF51_18200 [Solirubrobacteraceae bacterium]|nr:hypothetical protein [Solirubrobacteraceae bacterium]